jgi:hypothetical protein
MLAEGLQICGAILWLFALCVQPPRLQAGWQRHCTWADAEAKTWPQAIGHFGGYYGSKRHVRQLLRCHLKFKITASSYLFGSWPVY